MPGYADWKTLYREELFQMKEEGYDLSDAPAMTPGGESILPFPGMKCDSDNSEEVWEAAYHKLEEIAKQPLRADYPYTEPNDYDGILAAAAPMPALIPLSDEEYRERIRGAVYGRIAAVILGKPLEMGMDAAGVRAYLEGADAWPLDDYIPAQSPGSGMTARGDCIFSTRGNVKFAQSDDDIHYTLLALLLAEGHGIDFSADDVGRNWLDNIPYHWFWCASRQAYYHMVSGHPIADIPTALNPWRECIDGQIRCDVWGYLAPADPRRAALGAYRDCAFSLVKNGIYGGMFVAGCLAAALSQNPTVDLILDGGLSVIPAGSRLAEAVQLVRTWYAETASFDETCRRIYETYGHLPFAATINNLSIVVLSILHGNLDYTKTITSAVCGGIDTDCNAGTAGSIIGAAVGLGGIEERWYKPLNDTVKSCVASVGQISITEIIDRIIAQYERKQQK
ncbi:MAG: ADP-ribosylglycohydrolase family protein [Ruminococcaceae bacterium]|nr:ADP-ribosylglycohydrolase family protein [Oscillospiraceae bacterium]